MSTLAKGSQFRQAAWRPPQGAAREPYALDTANGNDVSYDGVSLLEIEDGKVTRFRAYFDPRTINDQVVS